MGLKKWEIYMQPSKFCDDGSTINISWSTCNMQEKKITRYIKRWINNWGHDLLELDFATKLDDGSYNISINQQKQIINNDQFVLSLDGRFSICSCFLAIVCVGKKYKFENDNWHHSSWRSNPIYFQLTATAKSEDRM